MLALVALVFGAACVLALVLALCQRLQKRETIDLDPADESEAGLGAQGTDTLHSSRAAVVEDESAAQQELTLVILWGPPAGGKGTQCRRIAEHFGFARVWCPPGSPGARCPVSDARYPPNPRIVASCDPKRSVR